MQDTGEYAIYTRIQADTIYMQNTGGCSTKHNNILTVVSEVSFFADNPVYSNENKNRKYCSFPVLFFHCFWICSHSQQLNDF